MARITEWMDLSELGDMTSLVAAGWAQLNGAEAITTSPRFTDSQGNGGSYAINISQNGTLRTPFLATPASEFYVRFHFRFDAIIWSGDREIFQWRNGSAVLGCLGLSDLGRINLYSGDRGTLLATSTSAFSVNTWYTVELHIIIGDSGTYELRVNGTSTSWIPSATGDTKPGTDANVDSLLLYAEHWTNLAATYNLYFDDFAADGAGWVGESIISALVPNGAGATTQLTPSSGANWQNVDEIPPSDADYNEATSANLKDTYVHTSVPGAASAVRCALLVARVAKTGTLINNGYLVVRSGGTDYESSANVLPTSFGYITNLYETDPATAAAWTVAGINNSQIGIRFDT